MCFFKFLLGWAFIIGGLILEVAWLGVCFGTVIIGIALLIFAPGILLAPMTIGFELGAITLDSCD